ncbi:DUF6457 domain-containing protein [Blastococcus sp. Marseille-P5729]|uniref:DUF6457 domain-containing protein n=1 Tax=Blastococcus sp. Marseille-P5729 TaxID=2086582 RepID=UPI000D0FA943|nr:DUF6457 domain-containing protein [Blastococcus sp. Marseille-P5729]
MTDLKECERRWHDWMVKACDQVGVDPQTVDIKAIHGLTKRVAHNIDRPLAPVSSYILGVAVGMAGASGDISKATHDALLRRLLSVVPKGSD